MADFADFDAFDQEEGPAIRLCGQVWQLPSRDDVPARAVARLERARAQAMQLAALGVSRDDDVPADLVDTFVDITPEGVCRLLLGDDMVSAWFAAGVSYTKLRRVSAAVFGYYVQGQPTLPTGDSETAGDDADPPAPAPTGSAQPSSSNTGDSSKRTSDASTESDSQPAASTTSPGASS